MKNNKNNEEIKNEIENNEETEGEETELVNLYMLVNAIYLDGFISMPDVYTFYDVIEEEGLYDFIGTLEECANAFNAAIALNDIKYGIPDGTGFKVNICPDCGGYYLTAN